MATRRRSEPTGSQRLQNIFCGIDKNKFIEYNKLDEMMLLNFTVHKNKKPRKCHSSAFFVLCYFFRLPYSHLQKSYSALAVNPVPTAMSNDVIISTVSPPPCYGWRQKQHLDYITLTYIRQAIIRHRFFFLLMTMLHKAARGSAGGTPATYDISFSLGLRCKT